MKSYDQLINVASSHASQDSSLSHLLFCSLHLKKDRSLQAIPNGRRWFSRLPNACSQRRIQFQKNHRAGCKGAHRVRFSWRSRPLVLWNPLRVNRTPSSSSNGCNLDSSSASTSSSFPSYYNSIPIPLLSPLVLPSLLESACMKEETTAKSHWIFAKFYSMENVWILFLVKYHQIILYNMQICSFPALENFCRLWVWCCSLVTFWFKHLMLFFLD